MHPCTHTQTGRTPMPSLSPLCSYINLLANPMTTAFFATMCFKGMRTGGFGFVSQSYIMLVPMVAVVAQGRRHGMFWFVMVLCQVAAMAILHATGYFAGRPPAAQALSLPVHIINNIIFDVGFMTVVLSFKFLQEDHQTSLIMVRNTCTRKHGLDSPPCTPLFP